VPRRGRRRREGTRWFADIHATPQAYHASPDAVIHRSAWNRNSRKFVCSPLHTRPARRARIACKGLHGPGWGMLPCYTGVWLCRGVDI